MYRYLHFYLYHIEEEARRFIVHRDCLFLLLQCSSLLFLVGIASLLGKTFLPFLVGIASLSGKNLGLRISCTLQSSFRIVNYLYHQPV